MMSRGAAEDDDASEHGRSTPGHARPERAFNLSLDDEDDGSGAAVFPEQTLGCKWLRGRRLCMIACPVPSAAARNTSRGWNSACKVRSLQRGPVNAEHVPWCGTADQASVAAHWPAVFSTRPGN